MTQAHPANVKGSNVFVRASNPVYDNELSLQLMLFLLNVIKNFVKKALFAFS